jgi:hypothetical protein
MELQIKTGNLIKDIFRNNWEETFIFDSINPISDFAMLGVK